MAINGPEVAKRIKDTVATRGMSMGEFYKESGISSALLSQWNTGAQNPTPPKLAAAAKALGKPIEYLAVGEEDIKKAAPSNGDELSDRDSRLLMWFRSLPEEKQKAILISQDAPKDLL